MSDVTVYSLSEPPRSNLCDAIPFRVFPRFERVLVRWCTSGLGETFARWMGRVCRVSVGGNSGVLVIPPLAPIVSVCGWGFDSSESRHV